MGKDHLIVDTNVPLKASDTNPKDEIDRDCSFACLEFIKKLMNSNDIIVIDSENEILKEYLKHMKKLRFDQNIATEFFKWVLMNKATNRVQEYKITKTADNTYVEFPESPELNDFDLSDRKFVALAKAHPLHPCIYNGSDTDWWDYKEALEKEGIHIVFLCEKYMIAKSKKKW